MTIYVDVETTGLDPRLDQLRVVAIDGQAFDVWGIADPTHKEQAHDILESRKTETFVAHNAQFDLEFLAEHLGYHHEGPVFDTMVAFQILTNGRNVSASLDNVCRKLLQKSLSKEFQKGPWDGLLDDQMLAYAAEDTRVLPPLHEKLEKALQKAKLSQVMRLEMLLLPMLVESRRKGVLFDIDAARQLQEELRREVSTLERELPDNLNPRSPQQVTAFFNLPDSSVDTLRDERNKLAMANNPGKALQYIKSVMEVRKKLKKISTIEKQLIGHIRYDDRIHPSYTLCSTETGRLSSRNPNLQNQDHGSDIRSLFIPAQGNKLVIADFSQLEVRIAALLCKDQNLLEVLWDDDRDMHTETQKRIFGNPDQMDKEERKTTRTLSKNILFGSLFGGGPNTVVRFAAKSDVDISEQEARLFQRQLFELYPGLKKWHEKAGNTNPEYAYSIQGRRRYITPGEGYCTRINHPVQSSAADGQKLAMVLLGQKYGLIPICNVHDELLFEVQEGVAEDVLDIVIDTMVDAMYRATKQDPDNPVVPIKVEGGIADDWSEKT